jgi:hypothetical protein
LKRVIDTGRRRKKKGNSEKGEEAKGASVLRF